MKISAEVREFAKANPHPFVPSEVEGRVPGDAPTLEEAEAGMAAMSERYRDGGNELYIGQVVREFACLSRSQAWVGSYTSEGSGGGDAAPPK